VGLTIGIFLVLIGATFASWGAYRLRRPRRQADVEWIRSNPLSNLTLGGSLFGFDRSGALASLLAGVVGILLGLAALLAS
jgi:high-affinity Fe2+/Pb2+ permease